VMKVEKAPLESYADIGGLEAQIQEIKEAVELPLTHPELYEDIGIKPPKGVILYGEPGTGKTLLAKAVANQTSATFLRVTGSELIQKYLGEGPKLVRELFRVAEEHAPSIVFIDEIDKVTSRSEGSGAEVSRQGVQRDLLPLVEGTTVSTKYGMIRTDHVLFIASGAFHLAKPSDLIPELQGRFPIRVELDSLSVADFECILTQTDACLTKQYEALLTTEGVTLDFSEEGVRRLAEIAWSVNERTENIGARRLHTVMERLLEEVSFSASEGRFEKVAIDATYVDARLAELAKNEDLSRYVL